jgi:hypothetical protein
VAFLHPLFWLSARQRLALEWFMRVSRYCTLTAPRFEDVKAKAWLVLHVARTYFPTGCCLSDMAIDSGATRLYISGGYK